MTERQVTVGGDLAGGRLDAAAAILFDKTRSAIQGLLEKELLTVNGRVEDKKYKVKEGDLLCLSSPEPAPCEAIAEDLPLEIVSESMSYAVTPLHPLNASAYDIFTILKDEYGIWICPNGGSLAEKIFRVGHIGALTPEDNTTLVNALKDLQKRGLL